MIQKHYILYNVDASQKVTMLEFDLALFKDHYTITKSIYSYNHAKKRITTFTSSKGFNGRTLQQQAFRDLEDRTNEFIQKGYRKLSYAVQKKLDQLTIDDLIDGFGEIRKDKNNIHKPMEPVDLNKCVLSDKLYLYTYSNDYQRTIVYYQNDTVGSTIKIPQDLLDTLKPIFLTNKFTELDCEWDASSNRLYIYDYISSESCKERLSYLETIQFPEFCTNMIYNTVEGIYRLTNLKIKSLKEGYKYIILKNPEKEYSPGRKSRLYMIKM